MNHIHVNVILFVPAIFQLPEDLLSVGHLEVDFLIPLNIRIIAEIH